MKVHDYHDGNRELQDRFETRGLADRLAQRASDFIGTEEKEFIQGANMFFLATCDHRGLPTCSYKGTVQVFDLTGHPTASRSYGWSHASEAGRRRFVAVLHRGPVDSPREAVRPQ